MSAKHVAILGGGVLGQSVARVLALGGGEVRLWARSEEARIKLKEEIPHAKLTETIGDACQDAGLIFFAVPAPTLAEVVAIYGDVAQGDHIVLHACRGMAEGGELPHQVFRRLTCVRKIGVLGGPLYITELAAGLPLAVVVASRYQETIDRVRAVSEGTPVRVHGSADVTGVEVAGAISNVSALAVGMAERLSLGDTARGILLTHGLSEAARLGAALGGSPATFAGLAGVGDLIPRRVTSTNRHYEVGHRLAEKSSLSQALEGIQGCVEGLVTAREAVRIGKRLGVDLPLVSAVDAVIRGEKPAFDALQEVLRLDFDPGRWLAAR